NCDFRVDKRPKMQKMLLFPILLAIACLVSGLYGALHNQISYTVAPAYFHEFKFDQFAIPESLRNRVGAPIAACHASRWMGILIGVPVFLLGLIIPGWQAYFARCLVAVAIVAGTTLAIGLGALAYACFTISEPIERAGTMHDFSYLGGVIGILTASAYLI